MLVRCRGMLYPHYVGAWDPVAWGKGARMTFRNAIVTRSTPIPNALCSIRPLALFSWMRYPRVPGEIEGRKKQNKKPQIKGSSLFLLLCPVLERQECDRQTNWILKASAPNEFLKAFFIQSRELANSMSRCRAKHSGMQGWEPREGAGWQRRSWLF